MGERSQIYVRYNQGCINEEKKKGLIANYYGWNYGERMISRARWGIEWINDNLKYGLSFYNMKPNVIKMSRIFDTNFDMKDIVFSIDIIENYHREFPEADFNEFVFKGQANNAGKLLVDIEEDCIKYAFLDWETDPKNIMDGEAYMIWNRGEKWRASQYLSETAVTACEDNIKKISELAKLMTEEEVEEFMNYDYEE